MTVLEGTIVLSSTLAQSLMIVNLPCIRHQAVSLSRREGWAHNYTVLPYLDVVSDGCCFHHGARANMNVVANLHRIVVEVATVGLIRWPKVPSQCKRLGCASR
jgi:hypothetical protein